MVTRKAVMELQEDEDEEEDDEEDEELDEKDQPGKDEEEDDDDWEVKLFTYASKPCSASRRIFPLVSSAYLLKISAFCSFQYVSQRRAFSFRASLKMLMIFSSGRFLFLACCT